MKKFKKVLAYICMLVIMFCGIIDYSGIYADASSGVSIRTTLENNSVQRGSKKTFDVIARDSSGNKIASSVSLNGANVNKTWDDSDKTSYTLNFTTEGTNTIVVSVGGSSSAYYITYKKAEKGDVIGKATFSVELFTIGCGYIIEPVPVDIIEGENSAVALLKLLKNKGFTCFYGGSTDKAFYLAYIADGTKSEKNYNGYNNMISAVGSPSAPKQLNLSPSIPAFLSLHLQNSMNYFDTDDYKNWNGYMGEFIFTNGSGWMYTVNNIFPNVSFADIYLSDGDVVRVQYTLGYGADIGGASAIGGNTTGGANQSQGNYYPVADKDRLTSLLAIANSNNLLGKADVKNSYNNALSVLKELNSTQAQVDSIANQMSSVLSKYVAINSAGTVLNGTTGSPNTTTSKPAPATSKTDKLNSDSVNPENSDESINSNSQAEDDSYSDIYEGNSSADSQSQTKSKNNSGLLLWVVTCVVLLVIAGATVYYVKIKNNKKEDENEENQKQ